MLNMTRGLNTTPENICVTRGSQMALYVIAHSIVDKDDAVIFEELTYPPAVQAFTLAGAKVQAAKLGPEGIDLNNLEAICRRTRVRAVYLTPGHQFPTTVVLRPSARLRLRALAAQFGFIVIEDDYDHEFQFDHQPMFPLASNNHAGRSSMSARSRKYFRRACASAMSPGLQTSSSRSAIGSALSTGRAIRLPSSPLSN